MRSTCFLVSFLYASLTLSQCLPAPSPFLHTAQLSVLARSPFPYSFPPCSSLERHSFAIPSCSSLAILQLSTIPACFSLASRILRHHTAEKCDPRARRFTCQGLVGTPSLLHSKQRHTSTISGCILLGCTPPLATSPLLLCVPQLGSSPVEQRITTNSLHPLFFASNSIGYA